MIVVIVRAKKAAPRGRLVVYALALPLITFPLVALLSV